VNDKAGARTQMAQIVTAVTVLAVLLLLAPVISLMPQATLAAAEKRRDELLEIERAAADRVRELRDYVRHKVPVLRDRIRVDAAHAKDLADAAGVARDTALAEAKDAEDEFVRVAGGAPVVATVSRKRPRRVVERERKAREAKASAFASAIAPLSQGIKKTLFELEQQRQSGAAPAIIPAAINPAAALPAGAIGAPPAYTSRWDAKLVVAPENYSVITKEDLLATLRANRVPIPLDRHSDPPLKPELFKMVTDGGHLEDLAELAEMKNRVPRPPSRVAKAAPTAAKAARATP